MNTERQPREPWRHQKAKKLIRPSTVLILGLSALIPSHADSQDQTNPETGTITNTHRNTPKPSNLEYENSNEITRIYLSDISKNFPYEPSNKEVEVVAAIAEGSTIEPIFDTKDIPLKNSDVELKNRDWILTHSGTLEFWASNEEINKQVNWVIQQSRLYGWNPVFILALWAQEDSFRGYNMGYQKASCLQNPPGAERLHTQFTCFFEDPSYRQFTNLEGFIGRWNNGSPTEIAAIKGIYRILTTQ